MTNKFILFQTTYFTRLNRQPSRENNRKHVQILIDTTSTDTEPISHDNRSKSLSRIRRFGKSHKSPKAAHNHDTSANLNPGYHWQGLSGSSDVSSDEKSSLREVEKIDKKRKKTMRKKNKGITRADIKLVNSLVPGEDHVELIGSLSELQAEVESAGSNNFRGMSIKRLDSVKQMRRPRAPPKSLDVTLHGGGVTPPDDVTPVPVLLTPSPQASTPVPALPPRDAPAPVPQHSPLLGKKSGWNAPEEWNFAPSEMALTRMTSLKKAAPKLPPRSPLSPRSVVRPPAPEIRSNWESPADWDVAPSETELKDILTSSPAVIMSGRVSDADDFDLVPPPLPPKAVKVRKPAYAVRRGK